jgi:hypothetical protein
MRMHALPEAARVGLAIPSPGARGSRPAAAAAGKPEAPSSAVWQGPGRPVEINPLPYGVWDPLLSSVPGTSFFHTAAWARVLHETYGHRPLYLARLVDDQLEEALPIMEVSSLVAGRRGVSLPFTDFCLPLKPSARLGAGLFEQAIQTGYKRGWRYLECRGSNYGWLTGTPSLNFYGHVISLQQELDDLFKKLDSAVRRGIRKAQNAKLQVEFSTTLEAMRTFFSLHCQTRRRHGLPPQPSRFFANIARHVLAGEHGFVCTARLEQRPIAAAVFLHHGRQAIYKFGASDFAFQHLRANNLVMWEAIRRYAGEGFENLHLGRTSLSNEGLRRFKLGFGAREEKIQYYKFDFAKSDFVTDTDRAEGWFNRVFRLLPPGLLRLAGKILYPHLS